MLQLTMLDCDISATHLIKTISMFNVFCVAYVEGSGLEISTSFLNIF